MIEAFHPRPYSPVAASDAPLDSGNMICLSALITL